MASWIRGKPEIPRTARPRQLDGVSDGLELIHGEGATNPLVADACDLVRADAFPGLRIEVWPSNQDLDWLRAVWPEFAPSNHGIVALRLHGPGLLSA